MAYDFAADPAADRLDILTAQVRHHLSGGRPNADGLDVRVVRVTVGEAFDAVTAEVLRANNDRLQVDFKDRLQLRKDRYFEDLRALKEMGGTVDAVLVRFPDTPTQTDAMGPYALLPPRFTELKRYQNLPGEEGVRNVYGPRKSLRFYPTRAGQSQMLSAAYPNAFPGIAFERVGEKVYFDVPKCETLPAKVTLELVIRDRPDDELGAPGLMEVTDLLIVARALELLGKKLPADKINNANATPQA